MRRKPSHPKVYKVLIQKSYRNSDGYIFMDPKDKDVATADRTFTLIYSFKKTNVHNPMFVINTVQGDDFKGRNRIIKHFEENHALAFAVKMDGLFEALNAS